jgi:hypothetical protein
VCEEREFLEIAEDFADPCEIFREAISNGFDAGATGMEISLFTIRKGSRDILRIEIADNGKGMNTEELQAFFDLGNSTTRENPATIGEKGHGTKIYYKSSRIEVVTNRDGIQLRAEVTDAYDSLAGNQKPKIKVASRPATEVGTHITIDDYNHSIRDKFTHAQIKDYILWFTKFGSVEREFGHNTNENVIIKLKGIDSDKAEQLRFGHTFPKPSASLDKLLDIYKAAAPEHFVRKWQTSGRLRNFPDISYEAVFYLEGDSAKREYNQMITGTGRKKQPGMYQVQERYGLYACKDYIPIERKNEWIVVKGSEFTRFHAFVNCQHFRLTANRGTIMNTPPAILDDVRSAVTDFFRNRILGSPEYSDIEWLESQAASYINQEKDERDFEKRLKRLSTRKVARYKGVELVEPENEIGVVALVIAIAAVDSNAFPFRILDYVTYRGYDALATLSRDDLPLERLSKAYVEFKFILRKQFDHLFKHLAAIVCWQLDACQGDAMVDIGGNQRTLKIVPADKDDKRTRYYLEYERSAQRLEIFVLKEYLKELLAIDFKHRGAEPVG